MLALRAARLRQGDPNEIRDVLSNVMEMLYEVDVETREDADD